MIHLLLLAGLGLSLTTLAAEAKSKDAKIVDSKYCEKLARKNKKRKHQWKVNLAEADSKFVSSNPDLIAAQSDYFIQKACKDAKNEKLTQEQFLQTLPEKVAGYAQETYEAIATSLIPEIKTIETAPSPTEE